MICVRDYFVLQPTSLCRPLPPTMAGDKCTVEVFKQFLHWVAMQLFSDRNSPFGEMLWDAKNLPVLSWTLDALENAPTSGWSEVSFCILTYGHCLSKLLTMYFHGILVCSGEKK